MTTNDMSIHWLWPYAAVAAVLVAAVLVAVIAIFRGRRRPPRDGMPVYSLDDDLNTEHASHLFHLWRLLGRIAVAALVAALAICTVLIARPAHVDRDAERSSSRDIVLCLDVSGSTLPYDRAVIETYLELVSHFQGERIALSIFNSTSRTVFPLTDDYDLVSSQLTKAADALRGVESQDDIDKMSDKDYQKIADWLEGTQNRKNSTSLIGDGLVSCAAMIPGFAYRARHRQRGVRHADVFTRPGARYGRSLAYQRGRPVLRATPERGRRHNHRDEAADRVPRRNVPHPVGLIRHQRAGEAD